MVAQSVYEISQRHRDISMQLASYFAFLIIIGYKTVEVAAMPYIYRWFITSSVGGSLPALHPNGPIYIL
jgi:hypothetical protein